jgi:hypothetical protein
VAYKFGEGQNNPDWVSFAIVGLTTWDWTVQNTSGSTNALSHTNLYNDGSAVPIPAAAWLFGSGLLLAGAARRKGKKV